MKRIAIISEHASPLATIGGVDSGGQNVYVAQVASHLSRLGYRVDVFTRRDNPGLAETAHHENGVRIVHVPAGPPRFVPKEELLPYMDEFTSFMISFLQREGGYALVHANFWMSGLVAMNIRRALDIPFVVTFHALGRVRRLYQKEADRFPDVRMDIEEDIMSRADCVLAECPQDEEDIIRLYRADPAKIRIVPCGFDPEEFWPVGKTISRLIIGLDPHDRIVLQLGRMVPRKGVETVIRAFARLPDDRLPATKLVIVGGEAESPDAVLTPEIGRLRAIAQELNVSDRVLFMGRVNRDRLKFFYSAADMFVTTPWYEPFGITPLEAMACGVPVIGSNVGGIKYSVLAGRTGFLVPPHDDRVLAAKMRELFAVNRLRETFGENAVARAHELFTWRTVSSSIAAVYERVIARRRPLYRSLPIAASSLRRPLAGPEVRVEDVLGRIRVLPEDGGDAAARPARLREEAAVERAETRQSGHAGRNLLHADKTEGRKENKRYARTKR